MHLIWLSNGQKGFGTELLIVNVIGGYGLPGGVFRQITHVQTAWLEEMLTRSVVGFPQIALGRTHDDLCHAEMGADLGTAVTELETSSAMRKNPDRGYPCRSLQMVHDADRLEAIAPGLGVCTRISILHVHEGGICRW